jgi:hypothetical protein
MVPLCDGPGMSMVPLFDGPGMLAHTMVRLSDRPGTLD